jgi:hypothetical protein
MRVYEYKELQRQLVSNGKKEAVRSFINRMLLEEANPSSRNGEACNMRGKYERCICNFISEN